MIDFFWTVGIKRYVFIDCENGDNSNAEKVFNFLKEKNFLEKETQIFCFIGADASQNRWYEKFLNNFDKKASLNISPIRIQDVGDNALDNVLSVYLGMVLAHNPTAEYVIVAFDNGYCAIPSHFGSIGVSIKKENLQIQESKKQFDEFVEKILAHYKDFKGKRKNLPSSLKTLRASISRFIKSNNPELEKSKDVIKAELMKHDEMKSIFTFL